MLKSGVALKTKTLPVLLFANGRSFWDLCSINHFNKWTKNTSNNQAHSGEVPHPFGSIFQPNTQFLLFCYSRAVAAVPTKQKEISRSPCLPKSTKAKAAIDNRHQDQAKNDNRYSLLCCSHPNRNKNKLASTTRRNSLLHELQNKNRIETGLIHQSPPQVSSGQRIMSSLSYVSDWWEN